MSDFWGFEEMAPEDEAKLPEIEKAIERADFEQEAVAVRSEAWANYQRDLNQRLQHEIDRESAKPGGLSFDARWRLIEKYQADGLGQPAPAARADNLSPEEMAEVNRRVELRGSTSERAKVQAVTQGDTARQNALRREYEQVLRQRVEQGDRAYAIERTRSEFKAKGLRFDWERIDGQNVPGLGWQPPTFQPSAPAGRQVPGAQGQEALRAGYEQELSLIHGNIDQIFDLKEKYRGMGLKI